MVPRQSSLCLIFALVLRMAGVLSAETAPAPQSLPYAQNFGTAGFTTQPTGMQAWGGLNGTTITSGVTAAASAPTTDATIASASVATSTGGCFGYATGNNGRFYIQTSSNASAGVNQLALAVNTTNWSSLVLSYDIEIVNAQPRTVGVICQYRIGTTGGWTTLTPATGDNPFSQAGGTAGLKTSPQIALPPLAENQPVVLIRWATWRGTETGNSSGLAIDNISVTGVATNTVLSASISPGSINEGAGANAATLTVTRDGNLGAALPVTLVLSDASEAAYDGPNPLNIPAGQSSVVFPIRAVDDDGFDGTQTVTLTATAPAAVTAIASLSVLDDEDSYSPPPSYYSNATGLTGNALKAALKVIASPINYQQFDYAASGPTGTYEPLRAIHEDPNNPANVLLAYSGTSIGKNTSYFPGANADTTWSREHVWPESYGLDPENVNPGGTGADAGPDFSDLFNLWPCFQTVNAQRSNRYYDNTSGTGTVPPLAPLCSYDTDSWEPRAAEKGDLARVIFYMAMRYDGTDPKTMDLEIGDTGSAAQGRFARLSTLLRWHEEDPVSPDERRRNQLIFANYQHNRNPFVDHPEYIALIWGGVKMSKLTAAVAEGGAADSYTIALASPPTDPVTIALSATPDGQITLAPSSVSFSPANWATPQTITVTGGRDVFYESTLVIPIQHAISSNDARYATLVPQEVMVMVEDTTALLRSYGGPWSGLPAGFVGSGLGSPYATDLGGTDGTSAKFDTQNDQLTITFNSAPAVLSYHLKGNPSSGNATSGTFLVLQSSDGVNFTTVRTVTDKDNAEQTYNDALSSATRSVRFRYSVRNGGNIQLDTIAITAAPPLASWASTFGLNDASAGELLDSDQDGWANLLEYAFGSSPVAAESTANRPILQYSTGALQMTVVVRTGDASLGMSVETTSNLQSGSWSTVGVTELEPIDQTGVVSGFVRRVFQVANPSPTGQFMHVVFGVN